MLTCKDYIFKLTSGQLEEAGTVERLWAVQHRMVCRHCRAFTRNDQRLDDIMQAYKEQLSKTPDST
ncbi:MAG TPA: hypothetical protein VFW84_04530 [Aquabacterium sp.]|uniref:hypothetical protein n=1 Tax=Aquabacterium sp. TaxID=1872578 RepID=UPI002D823973|nr:hypothetical protein [Aquabacterium sp.]HET6789655.1 hypothetical protein [Aquabacterium sp.]HEX5371978.1 hypothetical protein [Aquabacterium sp.]